MVEYDDARSGSFEPIREVPDDKIVVLGLVSTKTGRQETREELTTRIREASGFLPLDRLALSPQCGFSSSIVGNRISMEDQKRKLRVLVKTAEAIWA